MYKKYCLIASILLMIPFITTAMEVEVKPEEQKKIEWIYIQTNDGATLVFPENSPLFTLSEFFRAIAAGKFVKQGTADNPIILPKIDGNQLMLIRNFIVRKKDPEKLKRYLQDLNINDLNQLIVANDFLDVQKLSESVTPYLIKQLQDPDVLNAWLQVGGNQMLAENKELSDHMKQHLARSIKPTPCYLQQKKSIPSDVLKGHLKVVSSVAFSPDGTILASGSWDDTIKLWDIKTGTKIRTLTGHKYWVRSVAFSPDGTTLASGSEDRTIKLWNVKTGTEIRTLTGHELVVTAVAFSPDGTTLASGSYDYTIKLWNVKTGTEIRTLTGHWKVVSSVVFSPDGTILASGSWDDTIKLWNIKTSTEIRTLTGHSISVNSVAFNPNGTTLASGSEDRTIKLWNVKTGTKIHKLTGHTDWVRSVAFSPDGTTLASGSEDRTIKLWNVKTGTEIRTLTGHELVVTAVAFSPDGTILASGSDDNIRLWHLIDLQDLAQLSTLELLLIHAWQHAGIINLNTYPELNTIYNQASDLAKTLMPQQ